MRPAAFVDRDGVINEPVWDERTRSYESPYRPEDVALVPGAAAGLVLLQAAGLKLVVVSNQPAVAKGQVTLADLDAVHERVADALRSEGVELDGAYYCHHHPDFTGPCDCRKPAPGLLLQAAAELGLELDASWMIGDADSDVTAAHAAGARAVLVAHPRTAHRRSGTVAPEHTAPDLARAATLIAR
jgi:D-glycero-D-manno-heptose 1,7-bisphosphate phosphatase